MTPQGTPKGHPKSRKILFDPSWDPKRRAFAPRAEKSVSRALPGTSPYASRTVPAMVLACSTRCPRTIFFIILGSLLTPFSALWAPKWCLGAKKGRPPKTSKNELPTNQKVSPKYSPQSARGIRYFCFFGSFVFFRSIDAPSALNGPGDRFWLHCCRKSEILH